MLALLFLLSLPAAAETVEILRDSTGTPHIFAVTPAGAAFGAGYAQAQDRPEAILRNLTGSGDNTPLPPELASVVDAYVAGINRFFGEPRVTAAQVAAFARIAYQSIHGSRDVILGPTRTVNRTVIALLDPIASWNHSDRPYEMSLYATQGDFSVAGVAPPGLPFPIVGHSQNIAIGWSGSPERAGARALEEAWSLITARDVQELRAALAMNQIPGRAVCAAFTELCEAGPDGYLGADDPVIKEELRVQGTWSLGRVEDLASDTDVYKAEVWQRYLAREAPADRLSRFLQGWNRRADANSKGALAFYEFKMALGRDAALLEPPDSLSRDRLFAALTRARDRLEIELDFNANWGSTFRLTHEGSRKSYPLSGGILPEAGIQTPRAFLFRDNRAYEGPGATRVVELSRAPSAKSILLPGVSDDPESPYYEDQAKAARAKRAYFRDRREIERLRGPRKTLTYEPGPSPR